MTEKQRKDIIHWIHSVAGYSEIWLSGLHNKRLYAVKCSVEKKYGKMPSRWQKKPEQIEIYNPDSLKQVSLF